MPKNLKSILVHSLVYFIPVSIFQIGSGLGAGVQWVFFRYLETIFGSHWFPLASDIRYVADTTITGRSAVSLMVWGIGALVLLSATIIVLLQYDNNLKNTNKIVGILTWVSGLFFLISLIIQYGYLCSGPAGVSIPVGIPCIFIIGWYFYSLSEKISPSDEGLGRFLNIIPERLAPALKRFFEVVPKDLLFLIVISIVVKLFILFMHAGFPLFINDRMDIMYYFRYSSSILEGKIPYADFSIEYPVLSSLAFLVPAISHVISDDFSVYVLSFQVFMAIVDILLLVCLYFLTLRIFDQKTVYRICILYVTAFTAQYFVLMRYDVIPTCLLLLSIYLYTRREEALSVLTATVGFLVKWFPLVSIPYLWIHSVKFRKNSFGIYKGLLISVILILACTVPFLLLQPRVFLETYLFHFQRSPEIQSLVYLLDGISGTFFSVRPFSPILNLFMVIIECVLLYVFWKSPRDDLLSLCTFIFFALFTFVILNKVFSPQYLVWITPFLAIFLAHSIRQVVVYYVVQLIIYLEYPFLFGVLYPPTKTYEVLSNSRPTLAFLFYVLKFVILLLLILTIARQYRRRSEHIGDSHNLYGG